MSPTVLLIVLLGAAVGGAAVLLVSALSDHPEKREIGPRSPLLASVTAAGSLLPWAIGGAFLVLILTRWPVLTVATFLLIMFSRTLFGGGGSERRAIERLEGLAAWTESLRDTIAGAVGLEQAIPATAYAAAPSVQGPLTTLADRLRVRTPLTTSLQGFADDLDDPSADLIVAALMLNARLRGPGLRDVLSSLAQSARAELEMRRRVSAGRASTRRSVQIVVAITVVFVLGLSIFNRAYVEPYSSPAGQIVLLIVLLLFAAGFAWMRRLSVFELPDRFLFSLKPTDQGGGR